MIPFELARCLLPLRRAPRKCRTTPHSQLWHFVFPLDVVFPLASSVVRERAVDSGTESRGDATTNGADYRNLPRGKSSETIRAAPSLHRHARATAESEPSDCAGSEFVESRIEALLLFSQFRGGQILRFLQSGGGVYLHIRLDTSAFPIGLRNRIHRAGERHSDHEVIVNAMP